jgi:hypothetical protein
MFFFDQTARLCEAATGGRLDANGADSRKETRVLALMLGLQWYDQTSEHACSPSTMAVRAPMAVAEGCRAGHWHEHRHGRLRIQEGTLQALDGPGRASSRVPQSREVPEDACMVGSRRASSIKSWTRRWRAPRRL